MKHVFPNLDESFPSWGMANDAFPMSVVIVYNDMHAALRAAHTLERLGRKFRGQMRQRIQPVPVAYLEDPACFNHMLSDAKSADMIIVSYNGLGGLPATLKKWVADCAEQKRDSGTALIALLGSMDQTDAENSPRYQFVRNAARAAGLDFFAPKPKWRDAFEPEEEYIPIGEMAVVA
jgi:hypothetical protein